MPKFDSVTPGTGLRIRKKGDFPLNKLYIDVKSWLSDYEYDLTEKENSVKGKQKGNEVSIKLEASRIIDEYAKFELKINVLGKNIKKIGTKNNGEVEVRLYGVLNLDYEDRWQSSPFKSFLHNIYNNFLIKDKINNYYLSNLDKEVKDLQLTIKNILGLYDE